MTYLSVNRHPVLNTVLIKERVLCNDLLCSWCNRVGPFHSQGKVRSRRLWKYKIVDSDGREKRVPGLYCKLEHMLGGAVHERGGN